MVLLAALAGILIVTGILVTVLYFRPAPPKPARAKRGSKLTISKRTRTLLIVGVIAGVIAGAYTGIVILVVAVPAAIVWLPSVLGKQSTRDRDMLSALEAWSRSLAAAAETQRLTLQDVIGVTRTSAPEMIRIPVDRMYNRLKNAWSSTDALRAFADELDNVWADEVIIYLIQAAEAQQGGLADALNDLADNLAQHVKQRLEIYAEREKPRRTMVYMTWITLGALAWVLLTSRTQEGAFYTSLFGQIVVVLVVAMFAGLLAWAKKAAQTPPEERIFLTAISQEVRS